MLLQTLFKNVRQIGSPKRSLWTIKRYFIRNLTGRENCEWISNYRTRNLKLRQQAAGTPIRPTGVTVWPMPKAKRSFQDESTINTLSMCRFINDVSTIASTDNLPETIHLTINRVLRNLFVNNKISPSLNWLPFCVIQSWRPSPFIDNLLPSER